MHLSSAPTEKDYRHKNTKVTNISKENFSIHPSIFNTHILLHSGSEGSARRQGDTLTSRQFYHSSTKKDE